MTENREQDYFFLAALPRTGSTLLASILNQNCGFWVTPHTATTEVLRNIEQEMPGYEAVRLGGLTPQHLSLLKNVIPSMYANRTERYIVDYSRMWGAPYFYNLLCAVLNERPKIIVTVRPLPEIVASFIRKAEENPQTNFIDTGMVSRDFWPYHRKSLNDARVDYLLSHDSPLQGALLSLSGAYRQETTDSFHIIQYADLISEPDKTIAGIYDFFEVPRYPHTFNQITAKDAQDDATVLGIPDMHTVRPTLEITAPAPETILSDYAMTRCLIEDFWTER